METTAEQTTCLFCDKQFLTIAVALDHCRTDHDFDLLELKSKFYMDCYSYIKMINYIRKNKPLPKEIVESNEVLWKDDCYLKPGHVEGWLMYDFDDLGTAPSTPHYAIEGKTPLSNISYSDLQRKINVLEAELKEKCSLLKNAEKQISEMKQVTRSIIDTPLDDDKCKLSGDSDYFHSYSHFGIHHEMLDDKVRTESYQDAILQNSRLFKDKIVLDVGCGTGILSMFAAKAGAAKVYGIDQSDVVYKAMDIIRENNLQNQIHLIRGQIEDVNLPVDKFDIIVSEWMGYFLLFEGMLDSFIRARNKFLKPSGIVLPNKASISIVGISDPGSYDKYVHFWDNVYGFSMKCMKNDVLKEASIDTVPSEKIFTTSSVLKNFNLTTCDIHACQFKSKFSLEVISDGVLTALVGYFDIVFDLDKPVAFSTGPKSTKTHWQQTVFYLEETIMVKKGDKIDGTLQCLKLKNNPRGLSVIITLGSKEYQYYVN